MNTPAQAGSAQRKEQRIKSLKSHRTGAPTTRAREKEAITLAWLGVFGTLTTPMVKLLLAIEGDGYLPKLQRDGLVQCQAVGKMIQKVWTLTPQGLVAAELILGWEASRVRADRLNVSIATHDELGQLAALRLLQGYNSVSVNAIRRLHAERDLRQKGIAAPDVVIEGTYKETGGLSWYAIEIETSHKGDRELRAKMVRLIELLVQHERCDRLRVAWYLDGEKPKLRYLRVWEEALNEVKGHIRSDAYPAKAKERMQTLPYPTCSVHDLPK